MTQYAFFVWKLATSSPFDVLTIVADSASRLMLRRHSVHALDVSNTTASDFLYPFLTSSMSMRLSLGASKLRADLTCTSVTPIFVLTGSPRHTECTACFNCASVGATKWVCAITLCPIAMPF